MSPQHSNSQGKLFYVMGPSGSGKDSLLQYCREHNFDARTLQFAHRYITRAATGAGENHIYLSPQEFHARKDAKLFALSWHSHGLDYGIGIEIDHWLQSGVSVVVNGSREYLPVASEQYSNIIPIEVTVSLDVLEQRLKARGRESAEEISARLERNHNLKMPMAMKVTIPSIVIHNNATLPEAGEAMLNAFKERLTAPCAFNF
jgi:ribose 1,5-bisphosphokinase